MKIEEFKYVTNFYNRHLSHLLSLISEIDVKVDSDWPKGKPLQTFSDGSIIHIYNNWLYNDSNYGWLIHEVGHVLQNLGLDNREYIVNKFLFLEYPNVDNERVAWYWQYQYFKDKGYSKDLVLYVMENSYNDINGGTLWNEYKEAFFSKYYDNFMELS